MAWIELPEERLQKLKVFYDESRNQFQAVLTIHDQHFKDEADIWQDVDENLVDDITDGFNKTCNKTRHIFRIANGGNRRWYPRRNVLTEYVDITNIQYWRTTGGGSWRNINLPTPVWRGDGADWDMANLYASITNNWKRIKAEFILKDATAPTKLRFETSFVGLTYNPNTGELTSTTDGLVWGYINAPAAWYGNANPKFGSFIPVTSSYDGIYIEWGVDTTGATFPVYVDPTWTDGYGGDVTTYKDAIIDQGAPSTNYGNDAAIYDGNYSGSGTTNRITIQFAVSSIPGDPIIDSATFSLYVTGDYCGYARTHRVFRLKRAWEELQVTWNSYTTGNNWQTAGAFGTDDCEQTDIGNRAFSENEANGYKDFALTPTSKVNLDLGYGWLVKTDTEDLDMYEYASAEASQTARRPKLVVVYTEGGGPTEETVTLAKFDGISASSQTIEQDSALLDSHAGIYESSQTVEQDITNLEYNIGLNVAEEVSEIEESVVLDNHVGISAITQTSENDAISFEYALGILEISETNENDAVSLEYILGSLEIDETNENDSLVLNNYIELTVLEGITGAGIEEAISLAIYLSVTQHQPTIVDETVELDLILEISNLDQSEQQDSISLNCLLDEDAASNTDEKDTTSLGRFDGITAFNQTSEVDSVSLGRTDTIGELDQTSEIDSISLGRVDAVIPSSQTVENDATILAEFIAITVLEETQGFVNETVILARSAAIEILQEGISHVDENVIIDRVNEISEISQCLVNDNIVLDRLNGISEVEQLQIDVSTVLNRSDGINIFEEPQINDGIVLNRLNGISEVEQLQIDINIILDRSDGISIFEEPQINDGTVLNRLNGISEISQCQVNDNVILNRLSEINEVSQCQVNDDLLLTKVIRITVVEETQGNYSENVILDCFLGLTVFQEGISHVSEEVNFARLNTINVSEQIKLYDSLIFGRLNGIVSFPETQLYNSLILSKFDGLSAGSQDIINENITANKFNGLTTNSQIMVPESIVLSQLYGLAILDSRYLLENVDLQYSKGLSLLDSPTIFESINLGRINIITIISLLIGYNSISLGQFKSIIAEPPSLYVYNDGNHSVGVLFRDKRSGAPFRDKRAGAPWRDKRSGS